jgi:hypothetical protein
MFDHRTVQGTLDGTGVRAAGTGARWKVAFTAQLESIGKDIAEAIEKEKLS